MHIAQIRWLVFVLLVLALPARAADVVFPTGSRLGLAPPPGLTMSKTFVGFEDPGNNVAIAMMALPAEAFPRLDQSAEGDSLKRQGLITPTREPFELAAGKAFLVIGRQEVENLKLRKFIMVVSTPELTALITMQVPDSAQSAYPDDTVRAALASFAVRPAVPVEEQLSLVPFKMDDLAGFRVGGVIAGRAVVLTDAGPGIPGPTTDPQIVVAVAPGGPAQVADRETFARDTFAAIPNIKDIHILSAEPLRIGGLPGYQIMAQAKENASGIDITIVQWLRFGTGGYMQLVAVARSDAWTQAYPRFRQVRDGIELH